MTTLREEIINRLVNLQEFKADWSGGFSGARKSIDEQEKEYRESIAHDSDTNLLYVLLDLTKENAVRDNQDELG